MLMSSRYGVPVGCEMWRRRDPAGMSWPLKPNGGFAILTRTCEHQELLLAHTLEIPSCNLCLRVLEKSRALLLFRASFLLLDSALVVPGPKNIELRRTLHAALYL